MNQFSNWTQSEKKIARAAFEKAYNLECVEITKQVQKRLIESPDDLWNLEEFLSDKRKEIDQKYDYRYSVLLLVFSKLMIEGWLEIEELHGLHEDKLNQIKKMITFSNSA